MPNATMPLPAATPTSSPCTAITGLILAGGRGSRMGGVDKGLQTLHGQPLALHALQRLRSQRGISAVLISANRHLAQYRQFGVPVWPDEVPDHAGPLAGFLTGLAHCTTPLLLTVPCDTPLFPPDLAARLAAALHQANADIAMARAPDPDEPPGSPLRNQPAFCLLRTTLAPNLAAFLAEGGRKIGAWTARQRTVTVAFDQPGDDRNAFRNLNTLHDLHDLQALHTP